MNEKLLEVIKEFDKNLPTEFVTLYPDVNHQVLDMLKRDFPEYESQKETALVMYHDGTTSIFQGRYFVITNVFMYYRIGYLPYRFEVLDSIELKDIKQVDIKTGWLDSYIQVNDTKIGSIQLNSKKEARSLVNLINAILKNVDRGFSTQKKQLINTINSPCINLNDMENSQLFSLASEYFASINLAGRLWGFDWFYYGPFIPNDDLDLAKREYANYDTENEQPILFNYRPWRGMASGFVITNRYFYYLLSSSLTERPKPGKIPLVNINSFEIKFGFFERLFINGKQLILNHLEKRDAYAIQNLMNMFIKELHSGKLAENAEEQKIHSSAEVSQKAQGPNFEGWFESSLNMASKTKRKW